MAHSNLLLTHYAPAERAELETIYDQARSLSGLQPATKLLEPIPTMVVILNQQRQVIYANNALWIYLGWTESESPVGKRPGELLGCIHASETAGGCGTTRFCKTCGAINSILTAQKGKESAQECRIIRALCEIPDALDLRVYASPFEYDGESYTQFVIEDIGHQNRRRALERIFFHDVLNTAGGILGFSQLLTEEKKPELVAEFGNC